MYIIIKIITICMLIISRSVLEKDILEILNKATNSNIFKYNQNNLDDDFEYLFLIFSLSIYEADWRLPVGINRDQQQKDIQSDNIFIPNDPLVVLTI